MVILTGARAAHVNIPLINFIVFEQFHIKNRQWLMRCQIDRNREPDEQSKLFNRDATVLQPKRSQQQQRSYSGMLRITMTLSWCIYCESKVMVVQHLCTTSAIPCIFVPIKDSQEILFLLSRQQPNP